MRKEFPRTTPEAVGIPSASIEWLLDRLEEGWTEPHGLMIMRHGKVCAEGWWTPYATGIRHGLQSHTKTYACYRRRHRLHGRTFEADGPNCGYFCR